jgi:hypothetical protein
MDTVLVQKDKNISPINPNLEELRGQLLGVVFPNNGLQQGSHHRKEVKIRLASR